MKADLWIVVPAFREETVIGSTLQAVRAGAHVVRHPINLGQGAALQTGIEFAIAHGASHICTFDADGQHDAGTITTMLADLERTGADVALASRFLGSAPSMPRFRRLVLRFAVLVTRVQTRLALTDTHNGLRLFTRQAAERVHIRQAGMAHGSEILTIISREKMRVVETATTVYYTEYSRAKGQRLSNSFKIALDLMYSALSG